MRHSLHQGPKGPRSHPKVRKLEGELACDVHAAFMAARRFGDATLVSTDGYVARQSTE
jgi:hypothetical protein